MKKLTFLFILFFIAVHFTACKKEILHTEEIIRKHKLIYYPYWDSESTPFRRNASIYVNKETDSCMLILQNKQGDTILCHLDKSLVNMTNLQYEKNHNDWVIKKRDFGKTTYDSIGDWTSIAGRDFQRFPLDGYYTIDKKKKELNKIKYINKKKFLDKISSKFSFLKNCTLAGLDQSTTYVFKDTLNDKQVLHQLETEYKVEFTNGEYAVVPIFGHSSTNGIFKNRILCENDYNRMCFGEKVFYGKNNWDFNFRYDIIFRKYYKFKTKVKKHNNLPGVEIFRTEMAVYDWKEKQERIIKIFQKDSLFEYTHLGVALQKNGKYYVGEEYPGYTFGDFYYELDTIRWKLTKLKE